MTLAGRVHQLLLAREADERLGDEAAVERVARAVDLGFARAAARLGLLDHAPVGRRELRVAEELALAGHRQVDVCGRGPLVSEHPLHARDRAPDRREQRITALGIPDRVLQDIAHAHRPEVAQQQHPTVERSRDARRQEPGARDQREAERAIPVDRRRRGRRSLRAEHERLAAVDAPEDDGKVAAGPVQVRLDDLQREAGRADGVERVSARLEHGHPRLGCEPVRRRDHSERPAKLGSRGESVHAATFAARVLGRRRRRGRGWTRAP